MLGKLINLGGVPLKSPLQVTPQDITPNQEAVQRDTVEGQILDYCVEARSVQEILAHLGLKDRKNIMVYIKRPLEQGRIARTIPDKPNSSNQKYITIK